jgi:uncharacterized protein
MKVVIDTNVFVSSFFGGIPKKIIDLWSSGEIILCLSQPIIEEYLRVVQDLNLAEDEELRELLALFARGESVLFTAAPTEVNVSRDPGDDKFIECALSLRADVIISGDKDLTSIVEYAGIKILRPRQFLEFFRK